MRSFFVSLSGVNKALYFMFLCLSTIMVTYAGRTLLISDDLYFEFYGDQLSYERITEILHMVQKWEWASYMLIPVYYLVKVFLVGICIYIGAGSTHFPDPLNRLNSSMKLNDGSKASGTTVGLAVLKDKRLRCMLIHIR